MKINIFAGELDATFTSRILPLARTLEKYDVRTEIIPPIAWDSYFKGKLSKIMSVLVTHHPDKYVKTIGSRPDVTVIGRVSTPQLYLLQRLLKHRHVKTIFDLDDPLFLPTGRLFGLKVRPGTFYLEKMISNSDFVTVSSHLLLNYAKVFNPKADLVHVPVDINLFSPKHKKHSKKITIGWQGNPTGHLENLRIIAKPLETISAEYDIKFKIVSYLGNVEVRRIFKKLELSAEVDYGLNHWVSMKEFADFISDFDIMLAPLKRTLWFEGKSALRVGLGMAMGIPVVASPVGEQKYLVKSGTNGFLVEGEDDWRFCLVRLIEDNELRKKLGESARKTAEEELSLELCARKFYDIIKKVSERNLTAGSPWST
jgi:glycosyltransferase involved in cell wall biosynthesis